MPKEITTYYCDKCNNVFATKEEAQECEKKHLKYELYREIYGANKTYPICILLKFDNGQTMTYQRFPL